MVLSLSMLLRKAALPDDDIKLEGPYNFFNDEGIPAYNE
jgi:hypothetical protein